VSVKAIFLREKVIYLCAVVSGVKFELLGHLRSAAGASEVEVKLERRVGLTEALGRLPGQVRRQVLDASGRMQPGLLVLVNGVDVRTVVEGDVDVGDEDCVTLIPAIHGGARSCV